MVPSKPSKAKMRMRGFSLPPEDFAFIIQLAATSYEHNKSAALRAIIAEYRDRWYPGPAAIHATPFAAKWDGEQEPTDADRDD